MEKSKKINKGIIIAAVAVLAVAGITFAVFSPFKGNKDHVVTEYSKLSRTELVDSVSASGNVESSMSRNIYSSLNYPVKKIHVSVGDRVAEGDVLAELDTGTNAELTNAEYDLKTAQSDLAIKKTDYDKNKLLFESGAIPKQTLDESEEAYRLASYTNEKANSSLTAVRQTIEDSLIKSPADGVVTAVYAKEGSAGNGLLFIVEDIDHLVVTAYVKEYYAGKVQEGQEVTIESDSIGDKVIHGKVTAIDPASVKDSNGVSETSSAVEYKTKVAILDEDTQLKIGMNVRLNIILEKKSNVFAVPCDAVIINSEGKNVIRAIEDKNGDAIVRELEVEKGMETDLYTEISGSGVKDGVIVANDAASVKPGSVVQLQSETR